MVLSLFSTFTQLLHTFLLLHALSCKRCKIRLDKPLLFPMAEELLFAAHCQKYNRATCNQNKVTLV